MCQVVLFGPTFAASHFLYFLGCNFRGTLFVPASLDLGFLQFVKPLFVYLILFVQHDYAPNGRDICRRHTRAIANIMPVNTAAPQMANPGRSRPRPYRGSVTRQAG